MVKVSALSGLAKGSETVRDYLSHGSDENQGVEEREKERAEKKAKEKSVKNTKIKKLKK